MPLQFVSGASNDINVKGSPLPHYPQDEFEDDVDPLQELVPIILLRAGLPLFVAAREQEIEKRLFNTPLKKKVKKVSSTRQ